MNPRADLRHSLGALLLLVCATGLAAQEPPRPTLAPNTWTTASTTLRGVARIHMVYFTKDQAQVGMWADRVFVQCLGHRDGVTQWQFSVSRTESPFDGPERLSGWWQVGAEPVHGPIPILTGARPTAAIVYDDALTSRLREPVNDAIMLRIVQGDREWRFEFGSEGFAEAVAVFEAGCLA